MAGTILDVNTNQTVFNEITNIGSNSNPSITNAATAWVEWCALLGLNPADSNAGIADNNGVDAQLIDLGFSPTVDGTSTKVTVDTEGQIGFFFTNPVSAGNVFQVNHEGTAATKGYRSTTTLPAVYISARRVNFDLTMVSMKWQTTATTAVFYMRWASPGGTQNTSELAIMVKDNGNIEFVVSDYTNTGHFKTWTYDESFIQSMTDAVPSTLHGGFSQSVSPSTSYFYSSAMFGTVRGEIKAGTTKLDRLLRLYNVGDGLFVGETRSSAVDGTFAISVDSSGVYSGVVLDEGGTDYDPMVKTGMITDQPALEYSFDFFDTGTIPPVTPTFTATVSGNVTKLGLAFGARLIIISTDLIPKVVGETTSDDITGDYSVDVWPHEKEVMICLIPDYGVEFKINTAHIVDDMVHPLIPNKLVYRVTAIATDGVTGGVEPTWPGEGASVVSGNVTFTAEVMHRPLINGYVLPVRVNI